MLQPVLGGDDELESCLVANAKSLEDCSRIVWIVDEDDAAGQNAAEAALERLTGHNVETLVVPQAPVERSVNPKSFKLQIGLLGVTTEYIAVIDDDTIVGSEHMGRALETLRASVDLYTGLPSYVARGGTGSRLVAAFVNSNAALTYLTPLCCTSPRSINGMFVATRTSTLRSLGGFAAIDGELCDDLALAELYRDRGKSIHQGAMAQVLIAGGLGVSDYWRQMHRWFVFALVLMRRMSFGWKAWVAATSIVQSLLLGALFLSILGGMVHVGILASVLLLRHWALWVLLRATRDHSLNGLAERPRVGAFSSIVAELVIPLHAVHAAFHPVIRWRTRRYTVRRSGSFAVAEE